MNLKFTLFLLFVAIGGTGHAQAGKATYYHAKFYGKLTSTGERLDPRLYTAASKQYDWGTILQVTNLENGRTVQVRVNDCGPHARGNVLDLSQAAAVELKMIRAGRVDVKTRVVRKSEAGPTCSRGAWAKKLKTAGLPIPPPPPDWDPVETQGALTPAVITDVDSDVTTFPVKPAGNRVRPRASTTTAPPTSTAPARAPSERKRKTTQPAQAAIFSVKIGTFSSQASASRLKSTAELKGLAPVFILSDAKYHRVYAGSFYSQNEATTYRRAVQRAGYVDCLVRRVE